MSEPEGGGADCCPECGATFYTGDVQLATDGSGRLSEFKKCNNGHIHEEVIGDE